MAFSMFPILGTSILPFEDLQQQNRQSQADLKQLYKQQHGQHRQETIEDTIKNPTTTKARMNHQVNLHVPLIPKIRKKG